MEFIEINVSSNSRLPYIIIPEINAKFMIDTGSTKTLINEEIAYRYFPNIIEHDPFQIKTPHQTSDHSYSVRIHPSEIFRRPDILHKHYLFNFNPNYEGLIGIDLLKELRATIDFEKGLLITPHAEIPLYIQGQRMTPPKLNAQLNNSPTKILRTIKIPPQTEIPITIPVNNHDIEEGIINSYTFNNHVEIPAGICRVKNNQTTVLALNPTNEEQTIEIHDLEIYPWPIELNTLQTESMDYETIPTSYENLQKANLKNLRLEHLNQEEYKAIRNICYEYRDIMFCEGIPLTFTNQVKHSIRTTDNIPIYTKSYRYPPIHKQEVEKQMKSMMEQGIIRPSNSPWSSPLWIVPKKLDASGRKKWRIVIDYRKLNEKTIDDKYPLPNITDIFDKLGKCNYFTTLDLASGFHQIEMTQEDIEKTAFSTDKGHYEYVRMPFGLKNAPATFQRAMDNVLRGLQDICMVYLDDVIIFSTSLQEHVQSLRKVFERLRTTNFKIQLDKSEFLKPEVKYLGHIITEKGISPNPDKIKAVLEYPIPKTAKQIKGFLGLTGYYRKFIKNYAKLTKPLTTCLKKGNEVKHTPEFIEAFETCKKLLTNSPILQFPDFSKPFILTTDASNEALGAVLSQGIPGSDRPIAFASRTLNDTERNYSTIEKELLGIVWATKYFRPYLYGRKFTIYTDHRPLQWLHSLKEPNSKLMRWKIKLEDYDYNVVYKKGKLNTNADALSRIPIEIHPMENISTAGNADEDIDKLLNDIIQEREELNTPEPQMNVQVPQRSQTPLNLENLLQEDDNNTIHTTRTEEPRETISIAEEPINKEKRQIIIKILENPKGSKTQKLGNKRITKCYLTINYSREDLIAILKNYTNKDETFHLYSTRKELYTELAKLYSEIFNNNGPKLIWHTEKVKTLKTQEKISDTIKNYHEGKTNHRGSIETFQKLKRKYYFNDMLRTIQNYINSCEICQKAKYNRHPPKIPLNLTPTATKPFEHLFMDTVQIEQKIYLTIIDYFSKLGYAKKILCKEAATVGQALIEYFSLYKVPLKITTDNGSEFKNNLVKQILATQHIDIHFITPNHPDSNGPIERLHSTLLEHIRIFRVKEETKKKNIEELVQLALLAYNNTIHTNTGKSPNEILFGETVLEIDQPKTNDNIISDYTDKMKLLHEMVQTTNKRQKEKYIEYHNKSIVNPQNLFKPGQKVYLKENPTRGHKTTAKFKGPFILTSVNPDNTATIQLDATTNKKVHLSNLKTLLQMDETNNSRGTNHQTDPEQPGTSNS